MKIKINKKKMTRNILIITFSILTINYINNMNKYTDNKIKSVQEFTEYAKSEGLELTKENYLKHLNKK